MRRVWWWLAATAVMVLLAGLVRAADAGADQFGVVVHRKFLRSALTLHGRIVNSVGLPVAGATVTATQTGLDGTGAGPAGTVTTGADGGYVLRVGPGPSRLITVAGGASVMTIREEVEPSSYCSAAVRRGVVTVTGGVILASYQAEPGVEIQTLTLVGWTTVAR